MQIRRKPLEAGQLSADLAGPQPRDGIAFFESWSWRHHQGFKPISEDEAREQHESNGYYGVEFWQDGRRVRGVQIVKRLGTAIFLDGLGRQYLKYKHDDYDGERMYLSAINYWTYESDETETFDVIRYMNFCKDSTYRGTTQVEGSTTQEVVEGEIDIALLLRPKVEFGQYGYLFEDLDIGLM